MPKTFNEVEESEMPDTPLDIVTSASGTRETSSATRSGTSGHASCRGYGSPRPSDDDPMVLSRGAVGCLDAPVGSRRTVKNLLACAVLALFAPCAIAQTVKRLTEQEIVKRFGNEQVWAQTYAARLKWLQPPWEEGCVTCRPIS